MTDGITLPDYEPPATQAPARLSDGTTLLGRHTTTEEQRQAAVFHAIQSMQKDKATEARVTVKWSRGEPTILDVKAHVEHLGQARKPVYVVDRVLEYSTKGADLPNDPAARSLRLVGEVSEMVDRGMI